jgi:glutaredoxin
MSDVRTRRVTVVTRVGCHLCTDAETTVARLAAELGFSWNTVDVDGSRELQDAYADRVPVILVDGREHGYWRVEEARLRRALGAA